MAVSRSLNVQITGETRGFQKAVTDADKSLGRLSKSADDSSRKSSKAMHGMGSAAKSGFGAVAAGAGVAAAAVGAFAKTSVDAASDVEESISKNKVLFGEYTKDIEDFAKRSATALGISRRAALEYTGVFGNLSRAIGISKKDSAALSIELTTLGADLASFNNTSIEDALDALRSGLTGETEPLRRFGVTLSAVSVEAEAVRSGIVKLAQDSTKVKTAALQVEDAEKKAAAALKEHGKESLEYRRAANDVSAAQDRFARASKGTVPELNAQQKALATVEQIMRQTKTAQGDAERTAGNYAGQVKRLQARLDDLKVALGERLIPVFERAVKWTNELIGATSGADDRARKLSRGLTQAQKAAGEYGSAARDGSEKTGGFKGAMEDARKALGGYGRGLQRVTDALGPYVDAGKDAVEWTRKHEKALIALDIAIVTPAENLQRLAGILEGISAAAKGVKDNVKGLFGPLLNLGDDGKLFGDGLGQVRDNIQSAASISNFGGGLMGARPSMAPVAGAASRFGLRVSSGLRSGAITSSGNRSYHSTGEALDVAGTPSGMKGFFNFMKNTAGSRLAELIYTPGGAGIRNGASHTYSGQVAADHFDHVHVAVDTGVPGVGDGIGQAVDAARRAGFRGTDLVRAVAIAGAESRYDAEAQNLKYPDHSIGFWQINQLAHKGRFGTDRQLMDPYRNARAAYALFRESGFGPWSTWPAAAQSYMSQARAAISGGGGGSGGARGRSGRRVRTSGGGERTSYDPQSMYAPDPLDPMASIRGVNAGIVYSDQGIPILNTSPNRLGPPKGGLGPQKGLPPGFEAPEVDLPTGMDWLDLALAKAEATPGSEDDVAALRAIKAAKEGELAGATDPRIQAGLIRDITSLGQSIDALTAATEEQNRIQAERDALNKQIADNQLKILALANQGPQIVAAVVAAVSGGIGGQLGLGFQTPGFAGGVANYAGGGTGRL